MLKFRLILLAALLSVTVAAATGAEEFLARARAPHGTPTYAMLDGTLQHRRRGAETITLPLYFGVIIQPERTTGQLVVNNRDSYLLGQSRDSRNEGTSVIRSKGEGNTLDEVGVRASDLTMGFLYYDFDSELPEEILSAIVRCRVLKLKSPDGKELARVYLEKDRAFPLKAEFFHPGESEPFRTLETGGFTEKNGLYYARSLRIEGPGWRTRIEFDPDRAELGEYDSGNPPKVIRTVGD